MSEAPFAPARRPGGPGRALTASQTYAALDLGTNNCRLLVAAPAAEGFRIVDAYSRIVRLGEGLSLTGRLSDAAMQRAMSALTICADKIRRRGAVKVRAIATQACRSAENGAEFLDRVAGHTGLRLEIITPHQEAQLSVAGCLNLLDLETDAALVLDVGGGSTEISWVDLKGAQPGPGRGLNPARLPIKAWISLPMGVVTLAERFPEAEGDGEACFRAMVEAVKAPLAGFAPAEALRPVFDAGRAHLIGTSGAITSLAGLHLNLRKYDRSKVDGLWMTRGECIAVADRLARQTTLQRAAEPCIGPDRSDLVLAGAAILQAVQELWPCERVRVADRGLREGLLMSLMADPARRRGRRRRRRR
jgi:exopolyphosphatase/guanosine-5'-triphosphate,3'-diphosphate pyrophosphatase